MPSIHGKLDFWACTNSPCSSARTFARYCFSDTRRRSSSSKRRFSSVVSSIPRRKLPIISSVSCCRTKRTRDQGYSHIRMEAKKRAVAALVVKPAAQISNGPAKESTKVDSLQPVSVLCNQLKSLAPRHGFEPRLTAPKTVLQRDDQRPLSGSSAGLLLDCDHTIWQPS